ncbi:MAG: hypothetical protein HZA50_16770 [Planctomycetes bacterium]|nr:hypothetical protein [Planctomycetota bacterium]
MARHKYSELTAGIFVLVCIGAILGIVFWLAAKAALPGNNQVVFYADQSTGATGLGGGSPVKVNDLDIGKIAYVSYDSRNNRTLYTALLDRPMYSDGKADIVAVPLSPAFLSISNFGTATQPAAGMDHPIRISGGLAQAMDNIIKSTENLKDITESFKKELDPVRTGSLISVIKQIVADIKTAASKIAGISADVGEMIADAKPKVGKTLSSVQETAGQIEKYSKDDLADMFAKLRETNNHILKIARDFQTVSGQVSEMVALNRQNIDETLDNMRQVSADLKSAAKEVRRNPWKLFYQPSAREIATADLFDAARAFAGGAEELDRAIGRLESLKKAHPEGVPADDPQLKLVREQLEEAFSKFKKVEDTLWKQVEK